MKALISVFEHLFPKKELFVPDEPVPAFFHCTFALLGKLVIVDGEFCQNEMQAVRLFMEDAFRFSDKQQVSMQRVLTQGLNSDKDALEIAELFQDRFAHSNILRELLIDILLQVSVADGEYSEEEEALICQIAEKLGLEKRRFEQMRFRFTGNENSNSNALYYNLLGCEEDATADEVSLRFEELKQEYSEDTLQEAGFTPALLEYTSRRFERIEQAHAVILELKKNSSCKV